MIKIGSTCLLVIFLSTGKAIACDLELVKKSVAWIKANNDGATAMIELGCQEWRDDEIDAIGHIIRGIKSGQSHNQDAQDSVKQCDYDELAKAACE